MNTPGPQQHRRLSPLHVHRTLQVNILVAFATLLIITVIIIVGYTYQQNSQAILNLSRDLIAQVTETVIERTSNHLLPAAVMAQTSAQIPAVETMSLVQNVELEAYGMEILNLYPQLSGFYIGNEQGEFLFTKRFPDGSIGTQIIDRSGDQPVRTWTYRDEAGNVTNVEVTTEFTYDPRERPWYQGAKATRQQYWTDVYIFFTDQKPGITAAYPVLDAQGELISVVGIDIALDELSQFLATQKVGKNGHVFIINNREEVVAYPRISLATQEGDAFRLTNITDLHLPVISAAYAQHLAATQTAFTINLEGVRYIASFTPFPDTFGQDWDIGIVVPEDDFVGLIKQTNRISLIISLIILAFSIVLTIFLSRSISRPIVLLTAETQRISDLRLDSNLEIVSPIREVQTLVESISSMKTNLQIFKKYAPAELVRQLIQSGDTHDPGGQQKELTILFTDIGGFTHLYQGTLPEDLMQQLSEYVGELTTIILEEKGTLDTYMGEGLLAFWGAPLPTHHAYYACRAALLGRDQTRRLNQEWRAAGRITFPIRIGIHTGETLVGNIGSNQHMNYTVVGSNVNLAKYLQAANDLYGSQILVSAETYHQVADLFYFRPLDRIAIKDNYPTNIIYELMGEVGHTPQEVEELCARFHEGFAAYMRGEWDTAVSIFQALAMAYPQDSATQLYLGRSLTHYANPPGPDWTPTTNLEFFNQPRILA
ncbi:MAG: adenylate/guanylate cyclase domain-containing protein [Ardenticatenaceae bacterium]|nr:adenylate/guanylate cyclase domain-containing protein [Ardenticatenaceae bacterium]MCB8989180.1 adenylate/guanylate cyclase domain-containing protein [Ardenticatenaceae bacterium]